MLNSVFLFTGENIYTLRQEFQRRKTSFVEKFGADSLFVFNNENRDTGNIKQALYAGGLFVSKKMVIIEGVPKDLSSDGGLSADKVDKFFVDFEANQQLLSPDTMVIFLCYKPDKRTKSYKWLSENVQVKSFDPYKDSQLKTFIKENLAPFPIEIDEISYFLEKVGNDLFRIANEIEKLKFGLPAGTSITKEIIDEYCFGMVETNAFELFDKLFISPSLAVQHLEKMQYEGKDWNAVLGPITWSLRILLTLIDYGNRNIKDAKQIIAETKLTPFAVSKNMKNIEILLKHQEDIKQLFIKLLDAEYAIKSGNYPDIYFWLTIKKQLLNMKF